MTKKKRILFFVPLPPPVTGAGLRNKSLVESAILNSAFHIRVIPFNFADEVNSIGRFSFLKSFKSISRAFDILTHVVFFRPHLVYFNISLYGFALYRDAIYAALFKILGCKLLYHLRTQGVSKQIRESSFKRRIFRFVFKDVHVISLSEYLSKDIQEVYAGTPIIVNNGIEDVSQLFPTKEISGHVKVSILFVGHLWKFKGVFDLVNALKLLKAENVEFQATIVGPEGDILIPELLAMVEHLGLDENISVVGVKEGKEKHQIFRNADLFVLPTHWEAFPGVILEAMQFGLPVISTREGAIPEIIDDGVTGLLIKTGDAGDLAEKLRILIMDSSMRERLGCNGRIKFEKRYTLSQFENGMKAAFESVLHKVEKNENK